MSKTTVTIPADQGVRLREIASHLRLSVTDLIRVWISKASLDLGLEPDALDITVDDDGENRFLVIDFFDDAAVSLSRADAASFTEHLTRIAGIGGGAYVDIGSDLKVSRKGGGVIFESFAGEPRRRSVSVNVARQWAVEINAALAAP